MGMYGEIGAQGMTQMGANGEIFMSLIGRAMAQGDLNRAADLYQKAVDSLDAEQVPQFKQLVAEQVPGIERVVGTGEGRSAQSAALSRLQSFVDQQGLDAQARAMNEEALSSADQRAKGNRDALQMQAARRGMSGSGTELASMLQGNQASANNARQSSLDIAGQARQRALQALGQQAQLGTSMRGQDIDVESKNAAAQNARDDFNAKMRWAAQQGNNELLDTDYKNRMTKQAMLNQARMNQARRFDKGAAQTQGDWAKVGKAWNYKMQSAAEGSEEMPF